MSTALTRVEAKGWCPSAYQPMESGDGLVVRVRPRLARLSADQVRGLCDAAGRWGNGILELTNRANIQIRGIQASGHEALLADLKSLNLLDENPDIDARRNILTTPLWEEGDETQAISEMLAARILDLPELPAKFGFAVDCGYATLLRDAAADIRIERSESGGLILRPDGAPKGLKIASERAVDQAISLAYWFAETGGIDAKRMAAHLKQIDLPEAWLDETPASARAPLQPGDHPLGAIYGAPFGQIDAGDLHALLTGSGATALRVTPWRLFLLEEAKAEDHPAFICRPGDPLLTVDACPGLPRCAAATVETRDLARTLAGQVDGSLHVSGCAKGCARPRRADVTLVGRGGVLDLVQGGLPWDAPSEEGLEPAALRAKGLPR